MKKIFIFAGSNNNNLKLSNKIKDAFSGKAEVKIIDLVALDLPLYTTGEQEKGIPEVIQNAVIEIEKINSMIFVAPEYNGGIPPVLSNYISWMSVSAGKDFRKCFNGKTAAVATFSGGEGSHVLMAMRMQLSYIGMNVLGREIQVNYSKELSEKALIALVDSMT